MVPSGSGSSQADLAQLGRDDQDGQARLKAAKAAFQQAVKAKATADADLRALARQASTVDQQTTEARAAGALLAGKPPDPPETPTTALERLAALAQEQTAARQQLTARQQAIGDEQATLGGHESEIRTRLAAADLNAQRAQAGLDALADDLAELHAQSADPLGG